MSVASDLLREKAASLWYHDAKEIRMCEGEFITAFVAGELTAHQTTSGTTIWSYFGLKVIKDKEVSSGH